MEGAMLMLRARRGMLSTRDIRQEHVWSVPRAARKAGRLGWREGRAEKGERRQVNQCSLNHDKRPQEFNLQFLVFIYLLCDCWEILNYFPGVMVLYF